VTRFRFELEGLAWRAVLFTLFFVPAFVPNCASGAEPAVWVALGHGNTGAVRTWLTYPDGGIQAWTSTSTSTSTAANPWCDCQSRTPAWIGVGAAVGVMLATLMAACICLLCLWFLGKLWRRVRPR
jgi:hypothetical protein